MSERMTPIPFKQLMTWIKEEHDNFGTVFGVNALVVGPGLKTGLNIKIDDPSQLGSDLVCGSVAAAAKYPHFII